MPCTKLKYSNDFITWYEMIRKGITSEESSRSLREIIKCAWAVTGLAPLVEKLCSRAPEIERYLDVLDMAQIPNKLTSNDLHFDSDETQSETEENDKNDNAADNVAHKPKRSTPTELIIRGTLSNEVRAFTN